MREREEKKKVKKKGLSSEAPQWILDGVWVSPAQSAQQTQPGLSEAMLLISQTSSSQSALEEWVNIEAEVTKVQITYLNSCWKLLSMIWGFYAAQS